MSTILFASYNVLHRGGMMLCSDINIDTYLIVVLSLLVLFCLPSTIGVFAWPDVSCRVMNCGVSA